MGDWDEAEHPRNPADGKFVDKAGGDGWARKIAEMIGGGRTRTPQVDPDGEMRGSVRRSHGRVRARGSAYKTAARGRVYRPKARRRR